MDQDETLYSVKWYRGREEFYRYIPKELPHTRVFPLKGIDVDISKSGAQRVVLTDATPEMAGRFRCEVSADAPTFQTEIRSAWLTVVDPPEWPPKLVARRAWNGNGGATLDAVCASPPAYPVANITWMLNGKEISGGTVSNTLPEGFQWDNQPKTETTTHHTISTADVINNNEEHLQDMDYYEVPEVSIQATKKPYQRTGPDNRIPVISQLKYPIQSGMEKMSFKLTCMVTIYNLYAGRKESVFEEEQPEVASVLGVRNGCQDSHRRTQQFMSELILVVFIILR